MTSESDDAYIALGGNVGDVLRAFRTALAAMPKNGVEVVRVSNAYRTRAVTASPKETAPDFWNAVCHVRTELGPHALLGLMLKLERDAGRVRRLRWEPRPLDLDLLLYADRVIDTDALTVPHPLMHERTFVLQPLSDLEPDLPLSADGPTVTERLTQLATETGIIGRRKLRSRRRAGASA